MQNKLRIKYIRVLNELGIDGKTNNFKDGRWNE